MARYVTIVSGKGGVGKTTSSINLGAALSFFGKDVTVVDANLSTPNIGLHLGVPSVPIPLHRARQGKPRITEAVYLPPGGMKVILGGLALDELRKTNPDKLRKTLRLLRNTSDFILIDAAAGLGKEAQAAMDAGDEMLIVTNPELPAITDALKAIRLGEQMGKDVLGVILTRTKAHNLDVSVSNVQTLLEKPVVAVIPEDTAVREALTLKDAVLYTRPQSRAALSYKKLAADLIGQPYDPSKETKDTFFSSVLRFFRFAP